MTDLPRRRWFPKADKGPWNTCRFARNKLVHSINYCVSATCDTAGHSKQKISPSRNQREQNQNKLRRRLRRAALSAHRTYVPFLVRRPQRRRRRRHKANTNTKEHGMAKQLGNVFAAPVVWHAKKSIRPSAFATRRWRIGPPTGINRRTWWLIAWASCKSAKFKFILLTKYKTRVHSASMQQPIKTSVARGDRRATEQKWMGGASAPKTRTLGSAKI
jgi:hypothetical protein